MSNKGLQTPVLKKEEFLSVAAPLSKQLFWEAAEAYSLKREKPQWGRGTQVNVEAWQLASRNWSRLTTDCSSWKHFCFQQMLLPSQIKELITKKPKKLQGVQWGKDWNPKCKEDYWVSLYLTLTGYFLNLLSISENMRVKAGSEKKRHPNHQRAGAGIFNPHQILAELAWWCC